MKLRKQFDRPEKDTQFNCLTEKWEKTIDREPLTQTEVLSNLMDYADEHNLWIDWYDGCAEPGYDDQTVIAADWNGPYVNNQYDYDKNVRLTEHGKKRARMQKLAGWIQSYFDEVSLEWSDEWTSCSECYKAIRTSPDSYSYQPSYIMGDCYIACHECVKEVFKEGDECYLDDYLNSTTKAVPSWMIELVEERGFHCVEEDPIFKDTCKQYENGWYPGENDTPEKALEDMYKVFGKEWFEKNMDWVFCITGVGQFDLHFTILVRRKGVDE